MNLNLFSDCAFDNGVLYFYSVLNGYLGTWNILGDNRMEYCDLLGGAHNFVRTIFHHDKLYSLESSGRFLYIYDVYGNKHDVLEIPYNTYEYGNFIDLVEYDNKIVIFPKHQSEIMVLDTELRCTKRIKYETNILGTSYCSCKHKNFYYFFSVKESYALIIDLDNFQEQKVEINDVADEFVHCVSYGEMIFLLTDEGKVYSWDTIEMSMSKVYDFELLHRVHQIVVTERRIIVLPYYQRDDIFILERKERVSYAYSGYPMDFSYQGADVWNAYEGMAESEDLYIYAMRSTNYALLIDKVSGEIRWKRPENMDGQIMRIMVEHGETFFVENEECRSLRDLIGYVTANI